MGGIISSVGKLVGGGGGKKKMSQAEQMQGQQFDYVKNIRVPLLQDLQISPNDIEYFKVTGKFTPALMQATQMDKTLMEDLEANPDLIKDQMAGVETVKSRISQGGITAQDRARLNEVTKETDRQNRAQQESIGARLRERGAAGSPVEAMMRLQGQGAAADASAENAFKTAALAATSGMQQEEKLQDMLSKLVSQDVTLKSARAQAADERNKMNTNLLNQERLTNILMQNQAQAENLANQQRVADNNVGLANTRTLQNKDAIMTDFLNRQSKGESMAKAAGTYSGQLQDQAARRDAEKEAKWNQIGGTATKIGTTIGKMFMSDKNLKKDIKATGDKTDDMLAKLKGSTFKYKNEEHGEGERVGIMAQDLEKSELGKKLVKTTPEGKAIDVKNALGAIMASQARLSERLKKIEEQDKKKK